jgi:polyisoprenoid-binding protein YceI
MKRNRKGFVGIVIAVPVLIVAGFVLFFLGSQNLLPGQTQPTAIPVTPFANLGGAAPAGTTVAATTASAADSGYGNYGGYGNVMTANTAPTSTAPVAPAAAKAPAGATTYTIAGDKSEAKVTVNEKLARLPSPSDAVLTTNAIQGQLFLGPDTKPVEGAKIVVDLRTLKSDNNQRDNFIKQNTLKASQFPLAEYVVTGVDGWTEPLREGQSSTFKLLGNMTIHGVTKPVTFDTTATMQGSNVTGTATTTFKFQDFGMTPPNVSVAKADDTIKLNLNIAASKEG